MTTTGIILFVAGLILGIGGTALVMRQGRSESSIEKQLREIQEEFTAYRENVNQHLNQTTRLVNELTSNYISVQKHLADAKDSFTQQPKSFELENNAADASDPVELLTLKTSANTAKADAQFDDADIVEQPKDYAPKSAEDKGTLAEDFGLQKS